MNSQAWGAGRRPRWAGPPATCTCTCPTSTRPSGARSRRARRASCPSPTCSGGTATARGRIRPATGGASPRPRKTGRRRRWPSARRGSSRRWASRRRRSPMRDVHVSAITDAVKKLCIEANLDLEPDMLRAFDGALRRERSPAGKQVLQILKQNAEMARTRRIPYCQDTGFVVCFVELGQDVHVTGGGLDDAINEGVRQGYTEGYLRASIVLGVGGGGPFKKPATLPKKALSRELGPPNPDPQLDALEKELLDRANRLGIGPQGYGGDTTAFGIHILTYPCHITSLPVAVTIECHAHRHKEVTL